MTFKKIALICNYLSKDYAEAVFRLLLTHHNLSASEAASRLDLHIRTVQEFLEVMAEFDILNKEEVFERKRPYFRYSIKKKEINFSLDFLDEGSHTARLWRDDEDTERNPASLSSEELQGLTREDVIQVKMEKGGGFVMILD